MSYFRKLENQIDKLSKLLNKDDKWLILINADPDAIASAFALRRILKNKVNTADIGKINTISRPDNLAMLKYLRIPITNINKLNLSSYNKFALVDSQPSHNPIFENINFSIIIDHHNLKDEDIVKYNNPHALIDVRANYGATSSIITEYLYNLKIQPSKLLATALQYGIRTDTQNFERNYNEIDLRTFHYLSKHADQKIISIISNSEYLPEWLKSFSLAFNSLNICLNGYFAFPGEVDNPDILVVVADFFLKVHGLHWIAVCGVHSSKIICIFRGDGKSIDLSKLAQNCVEGIGSGGGHKNMARAECGLESTNGQNPEIFMFKKIHEVAKKLIKTKKIKSRKIN